MMKPKKTTSILLILFFSIFLYLPGISQTGPGGIGGYEDDIEEGAPLNALWLRAEDLQVDLGDGDPVPEWEDASGYDHIAVAGGGDFDAPVFETDKINGLPWVKFNGNAFFKIEDHDVLDGGMGIAMFCVIRNMKFDGDGTLLSKCLHWNFFSEHSATGTMMTQAEGQHSYDFWANNKRFIAFINGNLPNSNGQDTYTDTIYGQPEVDCVVDYIFNKNWGGTLRVNGETNTSRPEGNPNPITLGDEPVFAGTADLHIGVRFWDPSGWAEPTGSNYDAFFEGGISEIIMFKGELDSTQMIIVENYLHAKYNTSLQEDWIRYSDNIYINDVVGIGAETGNDVHPKSTTSALTIEGLNESIGAGEYLMAGHDNIDYDVTTDDVPQGYERWTRTWKFEKTGELDVKLTFNFSESGIKMDNQAIPKYRVLYREEATGEFTALSAVPSKLFNSLVFEIGNEELKTGHYTIGLMGEEVNGISLNQSSPLSDLRTYPNPFRENLTLQLVTPSAGFINVKLIDYTGRIVCENHYKKQVKAFEESINLTKLEKGIYILRIEMNGESISRKVTKY